ncbi:MAG: glutathionylspermidine synthase family protein [Cyanobacteria bacterium P01_F01_bin.150]
MERIEIRLRANWWQKCEAAGFYFYKHESGLPYWNEAACYRFSTKEVEELKTASATLHKMCLQAVDFVIRKNRFPQLRIPPDFASLCCKSWLRGDAPFLGRFDLVYDGAHPPKLLEYNADAATTLLESGAVQWAWLQEVYPNQSQFNSIHEKLLATFSQRGYLQNQILYFSCVRDSEEDLGTVEYLRNVAIQAGVQTQHIFIEDIGWNETQRIFCDLNEQQIGNLFTLYPWDWLLQDPFGRYLLEEPMRLLEPAWKMILSSKAILPILWELFPNHPNLLPSYYDRCQLDYPYVSKPVFSLKGENITIHNQKGVYKTPGSYADEPLIYQAYCPPPQFNGYYPIIGSWIIDQQAAGIGIREDSGPITQDSSFFVPHYIC